MSRILAALLGLLAFPALALAHAHLEEASPAEGAELSEPPATISIRFSEGLELPFSTLAILDEAGERVETGEPAHVDGDRQTLAVDVPPLEPGTYTVEWGAASVDTHRTEGSHRFTVLAP